MSLTVLNTIAIPDVEFGAHLLDGLDAHLVQAPVRTEAALVAAAAQADAVNTGVKTAWLQKWGCRQDARG